MKQVMALALSFVLTTGALALPAPQAGTTKSAKKKTNRSSTSAVAERLDKLQSTLDAQQQQIEQLRQDLQQRNGVIQQLQQQADQAKSCGNPGRSEGRNCSFAKRGPTKGHYRNSQ